MDNFIAFIISALTGIFAISSPFANLPVFLSVTQVADREAKKRIAKRSAWTAFMILVLFVFLGNIIFNLFGLTLPAFKITGGILIFKTGMDMIRAKPPGVKNMEEVKLDEDIAVSPLAIPILAGPGTIVTTMNFASNKPWYYLLAVIGAAGIIMLLNFLAFRMGEVLVKRIGENIITVIGKIMGLIIAIIGTDMILSGIKMSFPALDLIENYLLLK